MVVDVGGDKFCILHNGEVVTNQISARLTPTKISFSLLDFSRRLIGTDARYGKDYLTLQGFLVLLGLERTHSKVMKYMEYYALHDLVEHNDNGVTFKWLQECDLVDKLSIEHAVAALLLYIKYEFMMSQRDNNHNQLEEQVVDQVIDRCLSTRLSMIVPNEWNDRQKRSLLLAYKYANIEAGRLIPSGTALAMQYAMSRTSSLPSKMNPGCKYILFVDIGMSQCTLTLVLYSFWIDNDLKSSSSCTNHVRIINSLTECDHVNGMSINSLIHDILVVKYEQLHCEIPNKQQVAHSIKGKIYEEINEIKKSFSLGAKEVRVSIDRFYGHLDFNVTITKAEFESSLATVIVPLKAQFIKLTQETKLAINDIYEVELVGGSTRLPSIKHFIDTAILNKSKCMKTSLNVDEGAALGGMSIIMNKEFILHEILYYNYYIQIDGQEYTKLYKRGDSMCQSNKRQIHTDLHRKTEYMSLIILSSVSGAEQLTAVSTYMLYPPSVEVDSVPLIINFAINPRIGIVYIQNVECEIDEKVQQVHSRLVEDSAVAMNKVRQIEGKVKEAVIARDIKVSKRNDIERMLLRTKKSSDLPPCEVDLIAKIDTWLDEAVHADKLMEEYDEYFDALRSISCK